MSFWLYFFLTFYGFFVITVGCQSSGTSESSTPKEQPYIGSATCKSCHAQEYQDWKLSDHFLAMQQANDSTVLGDFNQVTFTADGVSNTFYKKDGKYFIHTQGEDGLYHDYEVQYTFGHFPLQQYLIALPGGRLQSTRVSWDSRDKKWFHQYAGQQIHHRDWLHWTGNSQNWNTMCASCHSTNLQKNYDVPSDSYKTTWSEINVSCESCHGPGKNHVDFLQSKAYQKGRRIKNSGFLYAQDTISRLQLNTCAPCHARKSDIAQEFMHSGELMDDMIPQVISNEFYHSDGQIKEEVYEYGSFTQSKMFHNNVRCSSCHNPHSGKLLKIGNDLCLSCHVPKYAKPEHHFHTAGTSGGECINCHMTTKTFMGIDVRRDHSFRIPRPDQSVLYGTPNACNDCHTKQTSAWAAKAIERWYGPDRTYHFSDDLLPGSLGTELSEKHLLQLLAKKTQPGIARATAAFYLSDNITPNSAQALLEALRDPDPLVRYQALRSLESFPPDTWVQKANSLLSDTVRAVRIAAADLYHLLSAEAMPPPAMEAFALADDENKSFLLYQADFSVGNIMLADYELQSGNYEAAIRYYLRGLQKDSLMNYARLNLSTAYNLVGNNQAALQTLQDAGAIDPRNDRIYYNLGLLYYELGDIPNAVTNFQTAVNHGSQHPGIYYNYGLLLHQQGNTTDAEKILLIGYDMQPMAANLNYALAFFYLQQNKPEKAMKYAAKLHQLDRQNPEYQELFRNLDLIH